MKKGECPECGHPITARNPHALVQAILGHVCARDDLGLLRALFDRETAHETPGRAR